MARNLRAQRVGLSRCGHMGGARWRHARVRLRPIRHCRSGKGHDYAGTAQRAMVARPAHGHRPPGVLRGQVGGGMRQARIIIYPLTDESAGWEFMWEAKCGTARSFGYTHSEKRAVYIATQAARELEKE